MCWWWSRNFLIATMAKQLTSYWFWSCITIDCHSFILVSIQRCQIPKILGPLLIKISARLHRLHIALHFATIVQLVLAPKLLQFHPLHHAEGNDILILPRMIEDLKKIRKGRKPSRSNIKSNHQIGIIGPLNSHELTCMIWFLHLTLCRKPHNWDPFRVNHEIIGTTNDSNRWLSTQPFQQLNPTCLSSSSGLATCVQIQSAQNIHRTTFSSTSLHQVEALTPTISKVSLSENSGDSGRLSILSSAITSSSDGHLVDVESDEEEEEAFSPDKVNWKGDKLWTRSGEEQKKATQFKIKFIH